MKEVYIKAEELNEDILNELTNKDIFSLTEIIQAFEEAVYKYKILEEEFEDYKEMINSKNTIL